MKGIKYKVSVVRDIKYLVRGIKKKGACKCLKHEGGVVRGIKYDEGRVRGIKHEGGVMRGIKHDGGMTKDIKQDDINRTLSTD